MYSGRQPEPVQDGQSDPSDEVAEGVNALMQRLIDEEAARMTEDDLRDLAKACPWPFADLSPELAYKQVMTWHVLDHVEPSTGMTPLRRFAERFAHDKALWGEFLKAEHPAWGEHVVREVMGHRVVLEDEATGIRRSTTVSENTLPMYSPGVRIQAVVHPYGDHWRTNGIVTFRPDEEAVAQSLGLITSSMMDSFMGDYERREAARVESMPIREGATLQSLLNKYPAQWVDGICSSLGLDRGGRKSGKAALISAHLSADGTRRAVASLSPEARAALEFLMDGHATVGMGALTKRFDAEVGWFWVEQPPRSPVGQLRARALVVVGKMAGAGGRMYRTAMVPLELRAGLVDALKASRAD